MFDPSELPTAKSARKAFRQLEQPLWTEAKALLIGRYLYYFVFVTKHGTYIDGFAGPQRPDQPEMWAAKLVLDNEPRWLRRFYFCDNDQAQILRLEALAASQPPDSKRRIEVLGGDFNQRVEDILDPAVITENEATFCLLDQRMFECQWKTLKKLAGHKTHKKIELFYFLPVGWLHRSIAAVRDQEKICSWWGRSEVADLIKADVWEKGRIIADRFRQELGYAYASSWPILKDKNEGRIMYFMVHASDHPEAPVLMRRAYARALTPLEPLDEVQAELDFGGK